MRLNVSARFDVAVSPCTGRKCTLSRDSQLQTSHVVIAVLGSFLADVKKNLQNYVYCKFKLYFRFGCNFFATNYTWFLEFWLSKFFLFSYCDFKKIWNGLYRAIMQSQKTKIDRTNNKKKKIHNTRTKTKEKYWIWKNRSNQTSEWKFLRAWFTPFGGEHLSAFLLYGAMGKNKPSIPLMVRCGDCILSASCQISSVFHFKQLTFCKNNKLVMIRLFS